MLLISDRQVKNYNGGGCDFKGEMEEGWEIEVGYENIGSYMNGTAVM